MSQRYLLLTLVLLLLGLAKCGGASDLEVPKAHAGAAGFAGRGSHPEAGAAGEIGAAGESGAAGETGNVTGGTGGAAGQGGPGTAGQGGEGGTPEVAIVALEITPTVKEVAVGTAALFSATARYADGSTGDVTAGARWASSAPSVASVTAGRVSALAAGSAIISATFGGASGSALVTVPAATVVSLTVTPATASVGIRGNQPFNAVVTLSDGSTEDVTQTATWTSSDDQVATIAAGVATGVAAGSATIRATSAGQTGTASLTVTSATLVSIAVTPSNATLPVGATLAFQATGTFSDGSTSDVSSSASWQSTDTGVATFAATTRVATAVAPGATDIVAKVGAVTGSTPLTVTAAALTGITITPTTSTIPVSGSVQLHATGTYADGTSVELTTSATWSSASPTVASVANASGSQGLVQGLAGGTAVITASFQGLSATASVTVTESKLVSIAVSPADATLPRSTTQAYTALGAYSDGSQADLTTTVSWSTGNSAVATIANAAGSQGLLSAIAAGTTSVTASLGGVSGSTNVTVTSATLVSIAVTPSNLTLAPGASHAMSALGTFSDNSTVDLTAAAVWTTDDPSVATVSNASGTKGTLAALAVGSTNVTATVSGVAGSTTVTVADATLTQIVIDPIAASVPVGQAVRYTAIAIFSDNSQRDVTGNATWTSSDTAVATIATGGGRGPGGGAVTATTRAAGTTTITATYQGLAGTTTLTATNATLSQIVVTPINPTLPVGRTQQLVATAIYSDNTSQNITNQATWQSSAPSVAQVSTGGGGPGPGGGAGSVTAQAPGSTDVSASWGGVTGATTITVTTATIASITVNPVTASLAVGAQQQFTAQAIYSDNTSVDVTQAATWISSNAAVAGVSDAGGPANGKGLAKALAAGSTTITASYGGVTGGATLTVTAATLVAVELTPIEPSVAVGTNVQFVATALYSDNTSRTVTAESTWTSSNASIASVSTAAGSRGLAQALKSGTATINATFGGVTGSATLHVTSATLKSIEITPFAPTLLVGIGMRFTATGVYSDNTTADLTSSATWTTNDSSVVSVSNANASRGQVSPLAAGSATVSATYQGVTGTDVVTVSSASITSIAVSPATPSIARHATQAFTATATLSDTTKLDVTTFVTWLSSDGSIAAISNASGSQGVATGLATGTVTITAVRGTVSGTAALTVN